jgi:hypothetical protein
MPVLSSTSSPPGPIPFLSSLNPQYIILAAILGLFIGIFMSRKKRPSSTLPTSSQDLEPVSEKTPLRNPQFERPPPPPPFTPPTLDLSAPQNTILSNYSDIPFTSSPTTFSPPQFPAFESSPSSSYDSVGGELPRRRSYTSKTIDGMNVEGEIIVAEGWRRHTKVFGGGVCKACEENKERMAR